MWKQLWDEEPAAAFAFMVALVAIVGAVVVDVGLHVGWAVVGMDGSLPINPVALLNQIVSGSPAIPRDVWMVAGGVAGGLFVVVVAVVMTVAVRRAGKLRGDRVARKVGRAAETRSINAKSVSSKAGRFGVDPKTHPGLPIGVAVAGGRKLYSSWEDVRVDIWGPRTGKTTRCAIPAILAAPGAVVSTSNKSDILLPFLGDGTRGDIRPALAQLRPGSRSWVFDPQDIARQPQEFWWDPLTFVTDSVTALVLAEVFADAMRDPTAQRQGYFDDASTQLLACMLLAAAVWPRAMSAMGGDPTRVGLTKIHQWLTDETDTEPVRILESAGETMMAGQLLGYINLVHETRSGVYGGALNTAAFLLNGAAMRWVTPQPGLPEFFPEDFVRSRDSLFLLSMEGPGSAAPVMTALTIAVTEAAIKQARAEGGRLATPMTVVLDEAANVCRWRRLPDLYSFYGSHGIVLLTILQSFEQGVVVWTREGMKKLWSSANTRVYGGGVDDTTFLGDLSQVIGDEWVTTRQSSSGRGGRSTSLSHESAQRRLVTVADLQSLPAGRMWVFASGARPVLASSQPWYEGPHADLISHPQPIR